MNRPSIETLGLAAAIALSSACEEPDYGGVELSNDTPVEDTDTRTDGDANIDADTDTDADVDSDTSTDTATDIAEVTTFTQATCERLRSELSNALDDLSLVQFVQSLGAQCTRDDRTFGDTLFEATLKDGVVGACVWNGEYTPADETRVTRVPATDAYPATLSVEAEIDSSGGGLVLGFYDASERLLAPDPDSSNPLWIYGDEAGQCTDMSLAYIK